MRQLLRIGHIGGNLATRTMRPQRSIGFSEKCLQAQNKGQGHVLLANRCLGNAGTLFEEIRGERICGTFRSINAHAEQKRFELSRTGNPSKSRNTTTVITANGEVQTREEAPAYVHDRELFVTVQILDDTPAVLSSGKPCEEHGNTHFSGPKPHLTENGEVFLCNTENVFLIVDPGLSSSSSASSSSALLPQDSSSTSLSPARLRSDDTHAEASGNRCDPPKKIFKKEGQQSSNEQWIARSPRVVRGVHR